MQKGSGLINTGSAVSGTKVMVNADTLFTIANGPIILLGLVSICISANDTTASTLQYQANPTVGSAKTISAASATLASATAGTTVSLNQTSLATAPDIVTAANGGVAIQPNVANRMIIPAGTIKAVIGVGSTTGTWQHFISFIPLAPGVTVS